MLDSILQIVTHPLFWTFVGGSVLFFGIQSIVAARSKQRSRRGASDRGLLDIRSNRKNRALRGITIFAILLMPVWLLLIYATMQGLWSIYATFPDPSKEWLLAERIHILAYIGLITALGALVAAPLPILRAWFTARQTDAQEQGLITDRINTAVAALGAEKEVNRLGRNITYFVSGEERVFIEWEDERRGLPDGADGGSVKAEPWQNYGLTRPNIEVRIGGLLSLEMLMRDNPEHHVTIMKILTAYIRENAGGVLPDHAPDEDAGHHAWWEWRQANPPKPPRLDVDTCLRVIEDNEGSGTPDTQTDPLSLERAPLAHLDLSGRKLQGVSLTRAELQGANLERAELQGADLGSAELDDATNLRSATPRGALLRFVDFTDIPQIADHVAGMFGVGEIGLPEGVDRPGHWMAAPETGDFFEDERQFRQAWRAWIEQMRATHPGDGWDEVPLPEIDP